MRRKKSRTVHVLIALAACLGVLAGCGGTANLPKAPSSGPTAIDLYRIGPGDVIRVFVWGNPGLSDTVPVRPDGRVSIPLIEDLVVAGKAPSEVGRQVEDELRKFVEDPLVTIIVTEFVGSFSQQVRVVGEAAEPQAIPYRAEMSLLDVMITVGGLTEFADGNRSVLVRTVDGKMTQFSVRLDDLIRDGNISANVPMQPGDVLIIPESYF